jgi:hypothetical protein
LPNLHAGSNPAAGCRGLQAKQRKTEIRLNMHKLTLILGLAALMSLSCSQKTEHAQEDYGPVKTYKTLKDRTDTIQTKAQQHSNTLDSIAGQ